PGQRAAGIARRHRDRDPDRARDRRLLAVMFGACSWPRPVCALATSRQPGRTLSALSSSRGVESLRVPVAEKTPLRCQPTRTPALCTSGTVLAEEVGAGTNVGLRMSTLGARHDRPQDPRWCFSLWSP